MEETLRLAHEKALEWTQDYGYHAVIPTLLVDPGGVPWAWVFLMLLAAEARMNPWLLILYGFVIMSVADHGFYWLAVKGGRPLLERVKARWPRLTQNVEKAETVVRDKGPGAILFGRFLPFVGRFVGLGAGLANVPFGKFVLYDALGVLITVAGFGVVAHLIGQQIISAPWFPQAVGTAFIGGTLLTLFTIAWQFWKSRFSKS